MSKAKAADPLALTELFAGGGEPWLPLLRPTLETHPSASDFIGPKRDSSIVPVRELTFQALKPHPPAEWKVIIFGQNPYPRVESATGIAMFDNSFNNWSESAFGRVTSIRCIIKAACMWKHGIARNTPIADIRALLSQNETVQPPEWFSAMLAQGVLLLNAALTASSDGYLSTDVHTAFWRPVVEKILDEILSAKKDADKKSRGVVFAWWGNHARALKSVVHQLEKKYPAVGVRHVEHCNPAAQGDIFCDNDHFAAVNSALKALKMSEVDWLPSVGWDTSGKHDSATVGRMGDFINKTMDLHRQYLERLQGVKDEGQVGLSPITGIGELPLLDFTSAMKPITKVLKYIRDDVEEALELGCDLRATQEKKLNADEIAAIFLYTTETGFYQSLNAVLRHPNRKRVVPYYRYLRLLLSALGKRPRYTKKLYRGVAADLVSQYPLGETIVWWGVSSCTSKLGVAKGFLGSSGKRMLFEITPHQAVGIKDYSSFTEEEEYLLAPGTQLRVTDVKTDKSGLCTVKLEEIADAALVS